MEYHGIDGGEERNGDKGMHGDEKRYTTWNNLGLEKDRILTLRRVQEQSKFFKHKQEDKKLLREAIVA